MRGLLPASEGQSDGSMIMHIDSKLKNIALSQFIGRFI